MNCSGYDFEVTPWFSRNEWNSVYGNIFGGNSLEAWKMAYNQMNVWKARVANLPVGIEATLPILHAQIAVNDASLDISFKNAIINLAILRFVSIVTKGYEKEFNEGKVLRNLASHINLPPYLVDLRNKIIHTDILFGTSQTLQAALSICFHWIKVNFWNKEAENYETVDISIKKPGMDQKQPNSHNEVTVDEHDELSSIFIEQLELLDSNITITTMHPEIQALRRNVVELCRSFKTYYLQNHESSVKALMEYLFFSSTVQSNFSKNWKKCRSCKCRIPGWLVRELSRLIMSILRFRALEYFIEQLILYANGFPGLCSDWITLFVGSFLVIEKKTCKLHRFRISRASQSCRPIKWKQILYLLFSIGQYWSNTLALEVAKWIQLEPSTCLALEDLSKVYCTSLTRNRQIDGDGVISDDIKTVSDLLVASRKISDDVGDYVGEVYSITQGNAPKRGNWTHCHSEECPLGLLPQQKNDPIFHIKLKLPDCSG